MPKTIFPKPVTSTPELESVTLLRNSGYSWESIGSALNLGKEYLRIHYGFLPRKFTKRGFIHSNHQITEQNSKPQKSTENNTNERFLRLLQASNGKF